jgi:multiple sugar transport system ATP-binding protein
MASVVLDRLTKVYPGGEVAVDEVDLAVGDGEFFVILGPSGSGKSTVVRMVAGLEEITAGDIVVGGRSILGQRTSERHLGMVSQQSTLYPHLTVRDNLALPLRIARVGRRRIRDRVDEIAAMVGLGPMLDLRPARLSGGMRQRAAIGRALVRDPSLLIMDEPMSNLDAKVRIDLRAELAALHRCTGTTTLYVTHDQVEAMALADRAAVMRAGRVVQIGAPTELYERPDDVFVARFIGSPPMTMVLGRIELERDRLRLELGPDVIDLGPASARPGLSRRHGTAVAVGIRPEAVTLAGTAGRSVRVEFTRSEFLGSKRLVTADVAAHEVREVGDRLVVDPMPATSLIALVEHEVDIDLWRPVPVALDPSRLHFFDLSTGRAIRSDRDRSSASIGRGAASATV